MRSETGWAVVAEGLGKRYGDRWALRDVDLYAPAGSVLCVIGPEGAGKTTLLEILASRTAPTTGYAHVERNARDVLLLDDPAAGLDPDARSELWATLRRHVHGGGTVVLAARALEDAEHIAGTVVVLEHGRVVDARAVGA